MRERHEASRTKLLQTGADGLDRQDRPRLFQILQQRVVLCNEMEVGFFMFNSVIAQPTVAFTVLLLPYVVSSKSCSSPFVGQ